MASPNENDDVPMLPISDSSSRTKPFTSRPRSVSLANTSSTIDGLDSSTVILGDTGPLQTQRSGKLRMCNDPYCTTCPSHYNCQAAQNPTSRDTVDSTSPDDAKSWARRFADRCLPPIVNPHSKFAQSWRQFFAFSCLLPIFVDPLFVFLIRVKKEEKCLSIDWTLAHLYVVVRTITDVLFLVYMMLQFRMAYVAPESTVVGAGQLVEDPKKIAGHYFRGKFKLDFFILIPLPQVLIIWIIPALLGVSGANYAKNILVFFVLFQYIPKLIRLLPLLAGETTTGFMFKSNWANFVINLSTFMLAGHFIGSCWYLLSLQRVNQCLRDACSHQKKHEFACRELIDCGSGNSSYSKYIESKGRPLWIKNKRVNACFQEDGGFAHGIYLKGVNLTTESNPAKRYIYSLFWGFQQISTLAGNQVPSYYPGEALFTMLIVGLGLLLFALLIGNMQQFLQGLCRRNLEMTLRRRDVEKWMSHRCLPKDIRGRVQEAERFNWAATRGVNEELLFQNMPDDIQRDIRRHLFKFLYKVSKFSGMDELVLDAIRGRLKQKIYIKNSTVLHSGDLLDKIIFIVRGEMKSIGEDNYVRHLSEGDVCGEELLTWGNSDDTMIWLPSKGMLSNRNVTCVTNVEAFSLSVADLEDVTNLFSRFLSHKVKRADSYGLEIPKETAS